MALANVAEWLYMQGARVIMVDWDLEAPGLENFFYSKPADREAVRFKPGLIDMLRTYKRQYTRIAQAYADFSDEELQSAVLQKLQPPVKMLHQIHMTNVPGTERAPGLWLLSAGARSEGRFPHYAEAVQDFNWADFYASYQGEDYFEWIRRQFVAQLDDRGQLLSEGFADAVLIDSRTGVTEMTGACTRQLADVVVAFCAPNAQNLQGVVQMLKSFRRPEILEARKGKPEVMLVPTRVDDAELEDLKNFESRFREAESQFQPPAFRGLERSAWDFRIPYVAKFSYQEVLTFGPEGSAAKVIPYDKMEDSYRQLATRLAAMAPIGSRLRGYGMARIERPVSRVAARVLLSFIDEDESFAIDLRQRLQSDVSGIVIWMDRAGATEELPAALHSVESLIVVMSQPAMESKALRRTWQYARRQGICVYPVKAAPDLDPTPRRTWKVRFFDLNTDWGALLKTITSPCETMRVPFMAPELPRGFVPRERVLEELRALFLGPNRNEPSPSTIVLRGAGGAGKSVLASALCHDEDIIEAFADGVLWCTLGKTPNLMASASSVYAALCGERPSFVDEADAAFQLGLKFEDQSLLIVIDDVWDGAHLKPFMRGGENCGRLVTTRIGDVLPEAHRVYVGEMSEEDALRVLTSGLAVPTPDALQQFANSLGRWPLPLRLARGVLAQRLQSGEPFDGVVAYLSRTVKRKGVEAFDRQSLDREHAISRSIEMSVEMLPNQAERERYAQLSVFPEGAEIPLNVVAALWGMDEFECEDLIQNLATLSLVEFDVKSRTIRLHEVLRSYLAAHVENKPELHARIVNAWSDFRNLPSEYAWRWVNYHLYHACMWAELERTLCDLAFIEAKSLAGMIYELMKDYDTAQTAKELQEPQRVRILEFGRFLRAQGPVLAGHPELTLQQALNEPDSSTVARSARVASERETRPRFRWVNKPQMPSPCLLTLSEHADYVNSCDVAPLGDRIVSASSDKELKVWDADTGRVLQTFRGHTSSIETCGISPDGKQIVSGTRNGEVWIWDVATGTARPLAGHEGPVTSCRFSPDGQRLVSASWDTTLKIWNVNTGTEERTLRGHASEVYACVFSPDGLWILSGTEDGALKLWDSTTGEDLPPFPGHKKAVLSCGFSPDGRFVFSASQDGTVKRWEVVTRKLCKTYGTPGAPVWTLALSQDGSRLASAGQEGSVSFWDVESGDLLLSVREHRSEIWGVAFFPNGGRAVSASWDTTLKVWSLETVERGGGSQAQVEGGDETFTPLGYMICCCCSRDGSWYAAGSADGYLMLWDAATGSALGAYPIHQDFVVACASSPNGEWILSGAWNGTIKLFDVAERRKGPSFEHPGTLLSCSFSRDGKLAFSCSAVTIRIWEIQGEDLRLRCAWEPEGEAFVTCAGAPDGRSIIAGFESGKLMLWDVASRTLVEPFSEHPGLLYCTLSLDGRRLASADERTIKIWDVESRRQIMELTGHTAKIVSCNFSEDGSRLVSAAWDQTVRLWDLEHPDCQMVLWGHSDRLQDACFSKDGKRIISVGVDGTVRLWEGETGASLGCLRWPANSASVCAFSPDQSHVVSASHRNALKFWNGKTGSLERIVGGHRDAVRDCDFSVRGLLVSASADGTLKLWDVASAKPSLTFTGHTGPVQSCTFSRDGTIVVSGGWDRTIRMWDSVNGKELQVLRGHDDWIQIVLITIDGSRILSCSHDKTVKIWDSSGRLLHTLGGHTSVIRAAACSPDGSRLVTGSADGVLYLWDIGSGEQLLKLEGHTAAINDCAYATKILSGSRDGTLRLWNNEQGLLSMVLKGHAGPVQTCRFSSDGKVAASGGADQFVRLWQTQTGSLFAHYWAGAPVESIRWQPDSYRIAVGDGMGKIHLLELEGTP
jgi:WD40 repeat protein